MKQINKILMIIGIILLLIAIISFTAKPVLAAILEYYGKITGTITITSFLIIRLKNEK